MEIIVVDDVLIDVILVIICEYVEWYLYVFWLIFRIENFGFNGNLIGVLLVVCGEYVVLCEVDDYWIDLLKLSK